MFSNRFFGQFSHVICKKRCNFIMNRNIDIDVANRLRIQNLADQQIRNVAILIIYNTKKTHTTPNMSSTNDISKTQALLTYFTSYGTVSKQHIMFMLIL